MICTVSLSTCIKKEDQSKSLHFHGGCAEQRELAAGLAIRLASFVVVRDRDRDRSPNVCEIILYSVVLSVEN